MSEKRLRKLMQRNLPKAHIQSHEDKYSSGIPDISIGLEIEQDKINGWIELKVTHLPKDLTLPLRIDNLKPQQVQWLKRRGRTGGRCFLFLRASNDFYLIHWSQLGRIGQWSWNLWRQQASGFWQKRVNWAELQAAIYKDEPKGVWVPLKLPAVSRPQAQRIALRRGR